MLRTSLFSIAKVVLLSSLIFHVQSRHIHHKHEHIHRHLRRAATLPSNVTSPSPTPTVTADAAAENIQQVQEDLSSLSGGFLRFVRALEQRIHQLEGLLASLLSNSQPDSQPPSTDLPAPQPYTAATTNGSLTPVTNMVATPPLSPSTESVRRTVTSTSFITLTHITSLPRPTSTPHLNSSGYADGSMPRNSTASPPYPSMYAPKPVTTPFANFTTTANTSNPTIAQSTQPVASATSSAYAFRPDAIDNVAVYYGAGPVAPIGGLLALCQNPNVDIVILAFLTQFVASEGYPKVVFEGGCNPTNTAQREQAPDLADCSELATEIAGCQEIGKPVLLSLGGYSGNTSFVSDNQAEHVAETLWNLFGAGTEDPDIRPFGNVTLDGFDFDNENHDPAHYETFATALRQQFALDPNNRTYYLSAAPQCPRPDQSIPLGALTQADFVWVQFYNNPDCNLDSTGFPASFAAWSQDLMNTTTTMGKPPPRLYIGAPGFPEAGTGYVPGADLRIYTGAATDLYVENLGGIMLWDGPSAAANVDQFGGSYLEYAKKALQ